MIIWLVIRDHRKKVLSDLRFFPFKASSFCFQSDVSPSFLWPPAVRAHRAHIIWRCAVNLIGNCCACCRVTAEGSCHYRWKSFSPELHGNSVNKLQSCDREFNRAVAIRPLTCFNPVLVSPYHHLTTAKGDGGRLPVWFQAGFPSVFPSIMCPAASSGGH